MKLSQLLPEYLPQYPFSVENEQDFDTLGLVVSPLDCPFCTFGDTERALETMNEHISMVITTAALAPKLVSDTRGVCIVDNPRAVFFRLHNALCRHQAYTRAVTPTKIGENCWLGYGCTVRNGIHVGNNARLNMGAVVSRDV